MELVGKHLLITRPEPENQLSCDFFRRTGARVTSLPMMQIQALDDNHQKSFIQSQILDLDSYQKVIFISKNAVRYGIEWIDHCWPQLPIGIKWIGIGAGTTKLINELGHHLGMLAEEHIKQTEGDTSEALLQHPALLDVEEEKILILGGEGGRTTLATTLKTRAAKVNSLALYKRAKITYSHDQLTATESSDIILVTSAEGLDNLMETLTLTSKNWFNTHIITPSQRVADKASKLGWKQVTNAQGADDQSLLAALIQL